MTPKEGFPWATVYGILAAIMAVMGVTGHVFLDWSYERATYSLALAAYTAACAAREEAKR